jgi:dolichyl-phosphate-mannose--protein O-mannosyl transferase
VAASLVAVEGGLLALLAVVELASLSSARLTMGLTTSVFFVVCGAALLLCAVLLHRRVSWARSPAVLAQLIQLGLAWSFRGEPTTWVAVGLAVVALVVLAGIFHPASLDALAEE